MFTMLKGQLFKYAGVGAVSAVINLFAYLIGVHYFLFGVVSSVFVFSIFVINNYVMNHLWTFKNENAGVRLSFRLFSYYVSGNILGLVLNLVVISLGVQVHFMRQLLGMFSNFFFAKEICLLPQGEGGV